MTNEQQALVNERTRLIKVWDVNKATLRRKRRDGFALTETDWKRWDEIDAFYGKKVAIIEHKMFQAGIMP